MAKPRTFDSYLGPVSVSETPAESSFSLEVDAVLTEIGDMLKEKNRKYGNSALSPVRIFSKASNIEQLDVRLDDKLSRIKSGQSDETEDVDLDLIGYLVIRLIAKKRMQLID